MAEIKTPLGTVVGLIPTPPPQKAAEEKPPEKPKRPSRAKAKG